MSTVQVLPQLTQVNFQHRLDKDLSSLRNIEEACRTRKATSTTSLADDPYFRPRQSSPASVLSVASAPLPYNNENVAPDQIDGVCRQRQSHVLLGDRFGNGNCKLRTQPSLQTVATRPSTSNATPHRAISLVQGKENDLGKDALLQAALEDLQKYKVARSRASAEPSDGLKSISIINFEHADLHHSNVPRPLPPSPQIAERVTEVSEIPCTPFDLRSEAQTASSDFTDRGALSPMWLRKRHSTSSGFVHTIKTASFSNLSFSMISKRFRYGHSSEIRFFGSHSRFSTDSGRPATMSSIDEKARSRGVKRRRIIEELVTTEESYVTDLKALVYLVSTLLASTTSVPNRVRNLVQRNVLDLLHIHEGLIESLHTAAFKAAARKWAETLVPQRLPSPARIRWGSLDSQITYRPSPDRRPERGSVDSRNLCRTRARFVGTEPSDLAEIIAVFRNAMTNFFAYEEYCANHEIIAHDLQRHLPNLWSSYSSGIESLARSLTALDKRDDHGRKALTVGDLLIKPIQRICKYPLLFDELLSYTSVSDDPSVHAEMETVLQCLRDIVDSVNSATQNPETRLEIHRRWALRAHLTFERLSTLQDDFRMLGNALLCGVLHVAYQTRHGTTGAYALCVLFSQGLLVALPVPATSRFDVVAFIQLQDLKVDSASDGKGLQSPSALHTWKLSFAIDGSLHEFLLSAASVVEEEQWKKGLLGKLTDRATRKTLPKQLTSCLALELRSTGTVYGRHNSLARRLSVQRAATVGNRASISQVVVRNTHNPEELHEFRQPSTASMNRSQSHLSSNRIVVLAPKRSERTRLESILNDVWTKDKLPYPGMIASRGGQIIRASAGSLARKLSFASIQGSFSRRSASLSMSTKKSHETLNDSKRERNRLPTFEIRRDSIDDRPTPRPKRKTSHDVPELDSMDALVSRMIGDAMPLQSITSMPRNDGIRRTGVLHKQPIQVTRLPVGPHDSAHAFYPEEVDKMKNVVSVEEALAGKSTKRWTNYVGLLKQRAADGFRNILYSTR